MAIVNSLVCWGGRTGKTVTISIASPAVVSLTNHGLRESVGIVFTSTGSLPTGITAGDTYYPKSTGTGTFNLYDTYANAIAGGTTGRINTSGSQSGTHTAKSDLIVNPVTRLAAFGLSGLSRWGASGSERIYDGIAAWNTARSSVVSGRDVEMCEIGEAFDERTTGISLAVKAARSYIQTKIDGKRTPAFHAGLLTEGYCAIGTSGTIFSVGGSPYEIDGLRESSGASAHGIIVAYPTCSFQNLILAASVTGAYGTIIQAQSTKFKNNLVYGYATGLRIDQSKDNSLVANSTFTKCTTGVYPISASAITGSFVNNVSVGNTTNWANVTMSSLEYSTNNAGLSTDSPWVSSGGSTLSITTGAFVDWANNDFRPTAGSPLIDAGVDYYNSPSFDLADAERPSYNNGGAETIDVGCYEFDKGFGNHPATFTLTLQGVVSGSSVQVQDQANTTTLYNGTATGVDVVIPITVTGTALDNLRIKVRKGSASPFYLPWETLATAVSGGTSIYVSQTPDE